MSATNGWATPSSCALRAFGDGTLCRRLIDRRHPVTHFTPEEGLALLKRLAALLSTAVLSAAPAHAFPIVGGNGLCPNGWALVNYLQSNYPGIQSIGAVRSDPLPDHPSGHAIDVMVGRDTLLGNQINADVLAQRARFGVVYTMWQVAHHLDHVHVTVS